MQIPVAGRRDIAENPFIRDVRARGIGYDIECAEKTIAVDRDPEEALPLAAGFGATHISEW